MIIGRRAFIASVTATLASAAKSLPANRNIKWALSAGLWSHYPAAPFTEILDVMRDTGFIGVRLTGFPGVLKTYSMTAAQLESVARRAWRRARQHSRVRRSGFRKGHVTCLAIRARRSFRRAAGASRGGCIRHDPTRAMALDDDHGSRIPRLAG